VVESASEIEVHRCWSPPPVAAKQTQN